MSDQKRETVGCQAVRLPTAKPGEEGREVVSFTCPKCTRREGASGPGNFTCRCGAALDLKLQPK